MNRSPSPWLQGPWDMTLPGSPAFSLKPIPLPRICQAHSSQRNLSGALPSLGRLFLLSHCVPFRHWGKCSLSVLVTTLVKPSFSVRGSQSPESLFCTLFTPPHSPRAEWPRNKDSCPLPRQCSVCRWDPHNEFSVPTRQCVAPDAFRIRAACILV